MLARLSRLSHLSIPSHWGMSLARIAKRREVDRRNASCADSHSLLRVGHSLIWCETFAVKKFAFPVPFPCSRGQGAIEQSANPLQRLAFSCVNPFAPLSGRALSADCRWQRAGALGGTGPRRAIDCTRAVGSARRRDMARHRLADRFRSRGAMLPGISKPERRDPRGCAASLRDARSRRHVP